jgi:phage baseplate assembly protein V
MMKIGIVTQLDPAKARVRVKFPEEDVQTEAEEPGMESFWLQVLHRWTLDTKAFTLPALNEQVVCLMDETMEFGVVLGGVYSDADPRPAAPDTSSHLEFSDGTILEYDPAAHKLTADIKGSLDAKTTGTAKLEAGGAATLKSPNIKLDGPVEITGLLTAKAGVNVTGTVDATVNMTAGGFVDATLGTKKAGVPYNHP